MKIFNLLLFIVAATCVSCSNIETVEEQEDLYETTSLATMTTEEEELFTIINEYRLSQGLNALKFDAEAYLVAQEHNDYMIMEGEISHDNFTDRAAEIISETGAVHVGENVARNFPSNESVLESWLDSQSHKENIVGDYTHSGISITIDEEGKPYFTEMFFKK